MSAEDLIENAARKLLAARKQDPEEVVWGVDANGFDRKKKRIEWAKLEMVDFAVKLNALGVGL